MGKPNNVAYGVPVLDSSAKLPSSFLAAILEAFAGVSAANDKIAYFTGSGTMDVTDFSSTGRSLVGVADAAAGRTVLGLGTLATQDADAVVLEGDLDADGYKLTGVGDAVNSGDVPNYGQLMALVRGLDWKDNVRTVRTTQLPPYTYDGGAKTITFNSNGALPSISSVSLSVGDRLLVIGETAGSQKYNGPYVVTDLGDGSSPVVLTRASDGDTSAKLTSGATFVVTEGDYANVGYRLTTADPIVLDTDALTFSVVPGVALTTDAPEDIGASASAGSASTAARADHVHADTGLMLADGSRAFSDEVTTAGRIGTNQTLTASGTISGTTDTVYLAQSSNTTALAGTLPAWAEGKEIAFARVGTGTAGVTLVGDGSDQIVDPGNAPASSYAVTPNFTGTIRGTSTAGTWMIFN